MAKPTRLITSLAALNAVLLVRVRPVRDPRLRAAAPVTPPAPLPSSGVSRPERF